MCKASDSSHSKKGIEDVEAEEELSLEETKSLLKKEDDTSTKQRSSFKKQLFKRALVFAFVVLLFAVSLYVNQADVFHFDSKNETVIIANATKLINHHLR